MSMYYDIQSVASLPGESLLGLAEGKTGRIWWCGRGPSTYAVDTRTPSTYRTGWPVVTEQHSMMIQQYYYHSTIPPTPTLIIHSIW